MKKKECAYCGEKKNKDQFYSDSDTCIECEKVIKKDDGFEGMDKEEREDYENLIEYFNKD